MMGEISQQAVIIGDSTNNTLSVVRSLGEANVAQTLILKCDEDTCFVAESKYLKIVRYIVFVRLRSACPYWNG